MAYDGMKQAEPILLQFLATAATGSLVVRVVILVFIDDIYQIVERFREYKRKHKGDEL